MSGLYLYCGLLFQSDIEFPELPSIAPEAGATPDITVRLAPVPKALPESLICTGVYEHTSREVLWRLPGVARYLVRESGRVIEVEEEPSADPADVRLFLLQPVFSLAAMLRGEWMLAASAVEWDGCVCAFAGPSGSGKSTAAAVLLQRGYRLVSDSLLRVTRGADGRMLAHPQAPWFWLWPDTIKHLGLDAVESEPLRSVITLRRVMYPTIGQPLPLTRIAVLREQKGDDLELFEPSAQQGAQAFDMLLRNVAAGTWQAALTNPRWLFLWCGQIVSKAIIERLDIPWGWDHMGVLGKQLDNWVKGNREL